MDIADEADAIIEAEQAREVSRIRALVHTGTAAFYCLCGEEIPHGRRLLGFSTCIDCAILAEKKCRIHS